MSGTDAQSNLMGCALPLLFACHAAAAPRPGCRRPTSRRPAATPATRPSPWTPPETRSPPGSARSRPGRASSSRSRPARRAATSAPPDDRGRSGHQAAGGDHQAAKCSSPGGTSLNLPGHSVLELATRAPGRRLLGAGRSPGAAHRGDPRGDRTRGEPGRGRRPGLDQPRPGFENRPTSRLFVEASVRPAGGASRRPKSSPRSRSSKKRAPSSAAPRSTIPGKRRSSGTTTAKPTPSSKPPVRPPGGEFSAPWKSTRRSPPAKARSAPTSARRRRRRDGRLAAVTTTSNTIEAADRCRRRVRPPSKALGNRRSCLQPPDRDRPTGPQPSSGSSPTRSISSSRRRPARSRGANSACPKTSRRAMEPRSPRSWRGTTTGRQRSPGPAPSGGQQVVEAAVSGPGRRLLAPAGISATSPDIMRPDVCDRRRRRRDGALAALERHQRDRPVRRLRRLRPRAARPLDPATGTSGAPVQFSVAPFDVWPIGPPSFDFGDGSGADRQRGLPRLRGARQLPGHGRREDAAGRRRRPGDDRDRAPQRLLDRQADAQPQEGNRQADGHRARPGQARPLRQGHQEGEPSGPPGRVRSSCRSGLRARPASASTRMAT